MVPGIQQRGLHALSSHYGLPFKSFDAPEHWFQKGMLRISPFLSRCPKGLGVSLLTFTLGFLDSKGGASPFAFALPDAAPDTRHGPRREEPDGLRQLLLREPRLRKDESGEAEVGKLWGPRGSCGRWGDLLFWGGGGAGGEGSWKECERLEDKSNRVQGV